MALNQDEKKKLDETHDAIIQVKTVLLGVNGDDGLCGDFKRVAESHYKLRRNFYLLCGVLIGSGILSGGVWAIFNF